MQSPPECAPAQPNPASPSRARPDDDRLLRDFAEQLPGVTQAATVSADGRALASWPDLCQERAAQLAAVASGLIGLSRCAARSFDTGGFSRTLVELQSGFLLLTAIEGDACLTVLTAPDADLERVGYEMALLGRQV
jgi:hypothetical protein